MSAAAKPDLHAVWGSSATDLFVVGDNGTILHSSDGGMTWPPQRSSTPVTLRGIWGAGNDRFAVGDNGIILHSTSGESTWTPEPSDDLDHNHLYGVGGRAKPYRPIAVGAKGQILSRLPEGTWRHVDSGTDQLLLGVWVSQDRASLAAAVGDQIVTPVDFPELWQPPQYKGQSLHSVWGNDAYIVAVGLAGTLARSMDGGKTWPVKTWKPVVDLNGVWGSAPDNVFAVGDSGTILHSTDGINWNPYQATPPMDLNGVWGSGPKDVYAVGDQATILHTTNGGGSWTQIPLP